MNYPNSNQSKEEDTLYEVKKQVACSFHEGARLLSTDIK
jgi:hypothetical protein